MRMYEEDATHIAFNVWDFASAEAVMDAAKETGQNVALQTSVGIYKSLPKKEFREFVSSYAKYLGIYSWLNLDHSKDEMLAIDAINYGWDSVMLDFSERSIEENAAAINRLHEYAANRKISAYIEAEVGVVRGVEDDIKATESHIASVADIDKFIATAKFDAIAVAFGNAHGSYYAPPLLHYELVEYATSRSKKPFVAHGASGLSKETIQKLARIRGVQKINISTDLKLAYKRGLLKASEENLLCSREFQPIKICECIKREVKREAVKKLQWLKEAER